jgi:hypothetical protein
VIVGNLGIPSLAVFPNEADSPLIVDPNAVLSSPIPAQSFQPITGRDAQIFEISRSIKCQELRASSSLDLPWQIANGIADENRCCALVGKALDHS